jgi:hypothetical protein
MSCSWKVIAGEAFSVQCELLIPRDSVVLDVKSVVPEPVT